MGMEDPIFTIQEQVLILSAHLVGLLVMRVKEAVNFNAHFVQDFLKITLLLKVPAPKLVHLVPTHSGKVIIWEIRHCLSVQHAIHLVRSAQINFSQHALLVTLDIISKELHA
jgi:hypothetical protein